MSRQTAIILVLLAALIVVRWVVLNTRDISARSRDSYASLLREMASVVAIVYFLFRPFVIQTFWIPSGSMIPTLREQDRIRVDIPARRLDLLVADDELARRRPEGLPLPRPTGSSLLERYRAAVSSAPRGAVLETPGAPS